MTSRGSRSVPAWLGLAWLGLGLVWSVFFLGVGDAVLRADLAERLRQHLLVTLDEANFSSAGGRINDEAALVQAGQGINEVLAGMVRTRWYSPQRSCEAIITSIDGVMIDSRLTSADIRLRLPRNQVEREIVLDVSCQPRALLIVGGWGLLGALFAALYWLLPPPLSREHRYLSGYMLGHGYDESLALDTLTQYPAQALTLSETQRDCLQRLHDEASGNFPQALAVVTDPRVAALAPSQLDWLLLGLADNPQGDLEAALVLAAAPDEALVDLPAGRLAVRGVDIPVGITPLLYYAWYAQRRLQGEGWVSNPAANRPDVEAGAELLALMREYGGHARAIKDLEQAGLKARTLDQNRSKIKEEMVVALGEELATNYLFEARKDADGLHMQYRLCPDGARIRLLQ